MESMYVCPLTLLFLWVCVLVLLLLFFVVVSSIVLFLFSLLFLVLLFLYCYSCQFRVSVCQCCVSVASNGGGGITFSFLLPKQSCQQRLESSPTLLVVLIACSKRISSEHSLFFVQSLFSLWFGKSWVYTLNNATRVNPDLHTTVIVFLVVWRTLYMTILPSNIRNHSSLSCNRFHCTGVAYSLCINHSFHNFLGTNCNTQ